MRKKEIMKERYTNIKTEREREGKIDGERGSKRGRGIKREIGERERGKG